LTSTNNASILFEAENIVKRIGSLVIADGISFAVPRGSVVGLIGPNGAGKTTMLGLLSGDVRLDAGTVRLNGRDVTRVGASQRARLGIGRTYQIPRPFSGLTVFEHALLAVQQTSHVAKNEANELAVASIERCGLANFMNVLGGDLRLLDRKRLEMARALALNPSIILLDEVAGGLSVLEVNELIDIVNGLRDEGIAFLWVEHVVRALTATADRVMCLYAGALIAEGSPSEVLKHPAVIESYFGSPAFTKDNA
jgi:branched-chain amino acid transport system ATP-binding protein